jgi:protein-L-isoaspartate(D-aspartate) O-methyltransferase
LFLTQNNYRAQLFFGDGFLGKKVFAPFDSIIVTCGAPYVPEELKDQLKGGWQIGNSSWSRGCATNDVNSAFK